MEADISILRKTGHFYFALTSRVQAEFSRVRQSSREVTRSATVFFKTPLSAVAFPRRLGYYVPALRETCAERSGAA